eukprot:CAMPEP_0195651636 /NCGR_PEP_ID=MMETSP0815-20121206/32383_1 /TAXON_ID=97485 /ORGANISM="Prymnesium parvum, Strain Texoma1" /LENGTH=83 /DNA_ID=CAMNT_0040795575 /DNA_START=208 /DNA_END=460 /DNA_ORIENTATION=-
MRQEGSSDHSRPSSSTYQAVERLHRLGGAHVADAKVQHVRAFSVVEVGHEAAMRRRRRAAGGGVFRLWRKLGLQAHERVDPGM